MPYITITVYDRLCTALILAFRALLEYIHITRKYLNLDRIKALHKRQISYMNIEVQVFEQRFFTVSHHGVFYGKKEKWRHGLRYKREFETVMSRFVTVL